MYTDYEYRQKPSTCKKLVSILWRPIMQCGRDFCLGTSMHGFKHVAVPGRHWLERLLWVGLTAAAICGAVGVSRDQWQRYNENPTVVTLEKDFRSWRFSVPAITACAKNRVDPTMLPEVIQRYWGVSPKDEKYSYYSQFVNTVANSDLFHLAGYQDYNDEELNVDLFELAVNVMPEAQIKTISSEDGRAVNFKWTPVMTEAGACYATNSLALADVAIVKPSPNDTKSYPITCKYSSQICYAMFEIIAETDFYVHSPYDVMDITTPVSSVYLTLSRITDLSVIESACGRGVRELRPQRRGCLYIDEPATGGRKVYSTNSCRLACRSRLAIKLCGCRPFHYFYEEGPTCTPSGMACLAGHAHQLASTSGVRCSCSPQCLDAVFREITNKDTIWEHGPFVTRGSVRYTIQPPRTRYTREIVFHFQDLVVSFGGAAGLFIGASFISFVEIIYFVLERTFGSLFRDGAEGKTAGVQESRVSFEAKRVVELTRILEEQGRFGGGWKRNFIKYK